jgi:hypothetical protein
MASKAKHETESASCGGEIVTRLCSINPTGLVFLATRRFEISSEVTLAVQTSAPGVSREWDARGFVVECRMVRCPEGLLYKITLLFQDVPEGLRSLLHDEKAAAPAAYPPLRQAPVFGLN